MWLRLVSGSLLRYVVLRYRVQKSARMLNANPKVGAGRKVTVGKMLALQA